MIQGLKAVPRFSSGRNIYEREQNAGNDLEDEDRQCSAAKNIEPACGFLRNGMLDRLANRRSHLQPQIEPLAESLDQTHFVPPRGAFAARPGVGNSPA